MKGFNARPLLFTAAGALVGIAYYTFIGCSTGCMITSSPVISVIYMGTLGFLISVITKRQKG